MPSRRSYTGLAEIDYPFHDKTVTVTTCGRICFNRRKTNLSVVLAGRTVIAVWRNYFHPPAADAEAAPWESRRRVASSARPVRLVG